MSKVGLFVIGWLRWLLDSSSMSLSLSPGLSRAACLLARSLARSLLCLCAPSLGSSTPANSIPRSEQAQA